MWLTASNINRAPWVLPFTKPTTDLDTLLGSQATPQQVVQFVQESVDHSMGEIGKIIETPESKEQAYTIMRKVSSMTVQISEIQNTHSGIPRILSIIAGSLESLDDVYEFFDNSNDQDIRGMAHNCLKLFISIASEKLGIPDTKTFYEKFFEIKTLVSKYRNIDLRRQKD